MSIRIDIVAIGGTGVLLLFVLELVRRRSLLERYALLWLFSSVVLLLLGIWHGLLKSIASAMGIYYPPSALFVIAFGFILVLLLDFSVAVSRLADQSKVLAQRLALLEQRQRELAGGPEAAGRPLERDSLPAPADLPILAQDTHHGGGQRADLEPRPGRPIEAP